MLVLLYSENPERDSDLIRDISGILEDARVASVLNTRKGGFAQAAERCDAIVLCDKKMDPMLFSRFVKESLDLDIPVYGPGYIMSAGLQEDFSGLEGRMKSWTEINAPQQARSFMRHIMEMYRIHLAKNHDYSPANITGPGMIGIATRMWDKIVRIMNLTGFQITAEHKGFAKPRRAVNEPYMDAFKDVAVYGVIAQIFQEGKWGK